MFGFSFGDYPFGGKAGEHEEVAQAEAPFARASAPSDKPSRKDRKQREHAMAKLMTNSHDLRLTQIEELCTRQADTIAQLKGDVEQLSVYSSAPTSAPDVRDIVDRSLSSFRDEVSARMNSFRRELQPLPNMQSQVATLCAEVEQLQHELSQGARERESTQQVSRDDFDVALSQTAKMLKDMGALRAYVEQGLKLVSDRHVEEVSDLKRNMQYLRDMQEYTAVKAGFLSLAASDCSTDEKQALFKALQEKESKLNLQNEYTASLDAPPVSPMGALDQMLNRADAIAIELDRRNGDPLGARVVPNEDQKTVRIDDISNGLLKDWNAANWAKAVRLGDIIVSVNTVRGDSQQLIKELSGNRVHNIVVKRAVPFQSGQRT